MVIKQIRPKSIDLELVERAFSKVILSCRHRFVLLHNVCPVDAIRVGSSSILALHVVDVSPGFGHVESKRERCQRRETTYPDDAIIPSVLGLLASSVVSRFLLAPEHVDVGSTVTRRPPQCGEPCAVRAQLSQGLPVDCDQSLFKVIAVVDAKVNVNVR
jgi:hypothetical protein